MAPVINDGDVVKVRGISGLPKVFDIAVFWKDEILVCHYVWHLNHLPGPDHQKVIVTRGLNGKEDLPVRESEILGISTSHHLPFFMKLKILLLHWLS